MRYAQIEQLRACRSDVHENRATGQRRRRSACSASGSTGASVTTPGRAAEIEGGALSPSAPAVGRSSSHRRRVARPVNASVGEAIRPTRAAKSGKSAHARFTLHVIDERRYGGSARTRNGPDQRAFRCDLEQPSSRSHAATSTAKSRTEASAACRTARFPRRKR